MAKTTADAQISPARRKRILWHVFGFSSAVLGILYAIFCDVIFNYFLSKGMVLRPNSDIFDMWKTPPIKLTLDFYMFNWTNSEDFLKNGTKPTFEELGPYRFTEIPDKVDIKWHPANASVTYKKRSLYHFNPTESNGSLNDKIVTVNALAMALAAKTKSWNSIRQTLIDMALKVYRHDASIERTVRELLFSGFKDGLLDVGNMIPSSITNVIVPFDRFGYVYPRNNSADALGEFNVHTGADDISKIGQIHTWKGNTTTKYFNAQCGQVYGSTGEFQRPDLQVNGTIDYFVPDFCRPITLEFKKQTVVEGVRGFEYTGGLRSVDNGTLYPENECYCNGDCVPSGVMNISSCWYGLKIFMSYPHFYNADPYFTQQVVGLRPEQQKHELYVVLEPKTGYVLEAVARMQSNLLLEPMSHISTFRNAPKVFFPLFWFELRTKITPDLAQNFKWFEYIVVGGRVFGWLCFIAGVIVLLWYPLKRRLRRHLMHQLEISDYDTAQMPASIKSDTIDDYPLLNEVQINALVSRLPTLLATQKQKELLPALT